MLRRSILVTAIAGTGLLAAVPGAAAATVVSPEEGTITRVELDLPASNGLRAHLKTSEKEVVTLELLNEEQAVTYEVQGEVTEAGLKVRFGRLGTIDVAFTPTTTLDSTGPSEGCTGAPRTLREGVFTGTIDFTGEHGYVRIEGPQATGSMSVISQWECPDNGFAPFRGGLRTALRPKGDDETASLHAYSRSCSCFFGAGLHHRSSGGKSIFYGARAEERDGMQISRVTSIRAAAGAFTFDQEAGTARLRPPPPFSGQAAYKRRPGRDLWRSTIRVPLLGAAPLRTDGPRFRAMLYPEYHFD
jgi:hypothetical protein